MTTTQRAPKPLAMTKAIAYLAFLVIVALAALAAFFLWQRDKAQEVSRRLSERSACIIDITTQHHIAIDNVIINAFERLPQQGALKEITKARDDLVNIEKICPPIRQP